LTHFNDFLENSFITDPKIFKPHNSEPIGTALFYHICDRRLIAHFLCENDDLDFALRTYLNSSFTGFDHFLSLKMAMGGTDYDDKNLEKNWNAFIDN